MFVQQHVRWKDILAQQLALFLTDVRLMWLYCVCCLCVLLALLEIDAFTVLNIAWWFKTKALLLFLSLTLYLLQIRNPHRTPVPAADLVPFSKEHSPRGRFAIVIWKTTSSPARAVIIQRLWCDNMASSMLCVQRQPARCTCLVDTHPLFVLATAFGHFLMVPENVLKGHF